MKRFFWVLLVLLVSASVTLACHRGGRRGHRNAGYGCGSDAGYAYGGGCTGASGGCTGYYGGGCTGSAPAAYYGAPTASYGCTGGAGCTGGLGGTPYQYQYAPPAGAPLPAAAPPREKVMPPRQ